ncbi:hypothetical protein BC833DRAFT_602395 [Globomyces pollinis-pini]|nr:hypothetical protein BC833DRAFT_602395 [Globomyces pollinis-pini]
MSQFPTEEDADRLQKICKVYSVMMLLLGFYNMYRQFERLLKNFKGHGKNYQLILVLLAFFSLQSDIIHTVDLFYPNYSLQSDILYRLRALLRMWPIFFVFYLIMIGNMEMFRLIAPLIPKFTSELISKIEITETVFAIVVGGGFLFWPFSKFDNFAARWLNVGGGLQFVCILLVVIQGIYSTSKMHKFAMKSSQKSANTKTNYQLAIRSILIFTAVGVVDFATALYAVVLTTNRQAVENGFRDNMLRVASFTYTLMAFCYGRVFESIKNVKFEKINGTY